MMYKTTFLMLLLFSANVLSTQAKTNEDTLVVKTLLYQITSPRTNKVSYLFGTHHAFGQTFFDTLQNAKQALLSSDMLIVEKLDIPGQMAEDIINQRTATTPWSRYLNKKDYSLVDSLLSKSEVDLNKVTPTELHVILSRYYHERICQAKAMTDSYHSLDGYIGEVGKNNGLALIGLETIEEQLELIAKDVEGMPRKIHKSRLKALIERVRLKKTDNCSEVDWYSRMDYDLQLVQPCHNTLVLTNRNNKWIAKTNQLLQTNNCFIAVGLSHLMFECGLINQLRKLEYTVTGIRVN